MRISLNGQERHTEARTLADLAQEEKAPERGVAIAHNGNVVRRALWAETALQEDDRIELIRAVQGG